jgi:lysophospholipase L1-like esterase
MRPAAEEWYGIGPEYVIASRPLTEMREVGPADPKTAASPNKRLDLVVLPELIVLNDEDRKPVSIGEQIGRRPIFAAGNVGTKGDIAMLRWSQSGDRPNLQLLVLHDDAEREMAYGEPSNASLEAAAAYGWHVVHMASDWKRVFASPLQKKTVPQSAASGPATPAAAGPPPTDWVKELAACTELDRTLPPAPGGVCLLGSSNISRWTTLAEDFPGLNVVNRGVSGCRLEELADHAAVIVAAARPRGVVVAAGTNDVSDGRTADDVRRSFQRLAANLQAAQPQATIVFLAISPTIRRRDQRDRQQAANLSVQQFIADRGPGERLVYLDANAAFLGPDGEPVAECFADDLQHPSTIGNARRAEIMRPLLQRLLEGAEGPGGLQTPLGTAPTRPGE